MRGNPKNLIGLKKGMVEVLFPLGADKQTRNWLWLARCKCGREFISSASNLTNKNYKSCGCLKNRKGEEHPSFSGHKGLYGKLWYRIIKGARNRGLKVSITKKYIWELFLLQNGKCALSGVDITLGDGHSGTASLDRISSLRGYLKNNVQWVHKNINLMKQTLTDKEFITWCHLVSNHNYEPTNKQTGS